MLVDLENQRPDIIARVEQGLYVPLHWSWHELLDDNHSEWYTFNHDWPEFQDEATNLKRFFDWFQSEGHFYEYGSCDSIEQFKDTDNYRAIVASPWPLLVTFMCFRRDDEQDGGYRFHKNGPYLGTKREGYEYLKDEPNIEEIHQFHVYRRRT